MDTNKLTIACLAGMLTATSALYPNAGMAASARLIYQHATDSCQATDPSNFTGLRFRTQGVYNASSGSIQVACGIPREFLSDNNTTDIDIFVHNFRTSPTTINCSVQAGSRYQGTMNIYPVSFSVPANGSTYNSVTNVDFVSTSYTNYAVSCIIPPKLELGVIRVNEEDDTGGL